MGSRRLSRHAISEEEAKEYARGFSGRLVQELRGTGPQAGVHQEATPNGSSTNVPPGRDTGPAEKDCKDWKQYGAIGRFRTISTVFGFESCALRALVGPRPGTLQAVALFVGGMRESALFSNHKRGMVSGGSICTSHSRSSNAD